MELDPRVALARRLVENVIQEQRHEVAEEILAENVEYHGPTTSTTGRREFLHWCDTVHRAWKDFTIKPHRHTLTTHTVALDYVMSGFHTSDFLGIPPSNRHFSVKGRMTIRIRNGRIISIESVYDTQSLLKQVGVLEPVAHGARHRHSRT
ncbi:ester cyclase [candidate division KSB1 bacterium]|nr:ester cyclase [candidate division KSB1 bacterium]